MPVTSYKLYGNIGVITIDNPPVNALSHPLRMGLKEHLEKARKDSSKAVLIICEGRTFISGADITEFGSPVKEPSLHNILAIIENMQKPVIAAIHGSALGGGFEVALACHYRCALDTARVGFPEVKLGLIPGASGTQRVPRLTDIKTALDLITSGALIPATTAHKKGLIDHMTEGDLLTGALAYAQELVAQQALPRRVCDMVINETGIGPGLFDSYRKKLAKRARGQQAPQHIIDCIEAAITLPFKKGLQLERDRFIACMKSAQSSAMRHLFFAEREATKIKDINPATPIREIRSVGIIGAGTMGGGIAMNFANAGIPVTLLDVNEEGLGRGRRMIRKNYQISVKRGKLNEAQLEERMGLITGSTSYDDLQSADLVIEAVYEDPDIKKSVFTRLDQICRPGAILATNTSYQDVNAIAAATSRPQDVIGLHFFSPANVMKLLEVVRGEKTADEVVATSMKLARTINKVPVLAGVCYGFIGNRMLSGYVREAQMLLLEGATPEQVDNAVQTWGMAMGPLAMGDLAGLDIGYKARKERSDLPDDPKYCRIGDLLVEMGRLGQKSGKGFYRYDAETRSRHSDPEVETLIRSERERLDVTGRTISDKEIVARLIYSLVNEGARILDEGIAQRPGDIDIIYVFGYGFPAFRGGPMYYADTLGLKEVYDTICKFRDRTPEDKYNRIYWEPAPLLEKLAGEEKTFAEWSVSRG